MRLRLRRGPGQLLAALVVVLLGLGLATTAATAQEPAGEGDLVVRAVDGRDPDAVVVDFLYTGERAAVGDLVIRENGRIVANEPAVLLEDSQDFGIVLAIDTSGSMREGDAMAEAIDAAVAFVEAKEPADQIAVVTFDFTTEVVQGFTDDADELVEAIEGLEADGGTAVHDAVLRSVALFDETDLVPNVVLLTDGADTDSAASLGAAQSALAESGTLLFAIGIETDELDLAPLDALAGPTGGQVLSSDAGDLAGVYAEVQSSLRRQFRTTFVSEAERAGPLSLTLTVGNDQTSASYQAGARLDSALEVEPVPAPEPGGIEALQSDAFLWVALLLLVVAAAGAVYAVVTSVVRERSTLDTVMQPYQDGFVAPDEDDDRLATTAILQRAVDITGRFAERRGVLTWLESQLEQANLPLRAGEALFFYLACVVVVAALGAALTASVAGTLVIFLLAALIPPATVSFLAGRRRKAFQAQLPDMLNLLASTLRAGYSLMQGIDAAAMEVAEPMARELHRVSSESRLGLPVEQALDGVAERMGSKDFEWAVMAIRIQREVGGNLAELLVTVAETMTERERLRRDVSSLTAEGRVSAFVLGLLPIGLGAAMFAINPDYIGGLFEGGFGTVLVVASLLLMGAGFAWMYKIIDIEV